jgi:hypothetical protein
MGLSCSGGAWRISGVSGSGLRRAAAPSGRGVVAVRGKLQFAAPAMAPWPRLPVAAWPGNRGRGLEAGVEGLGNELGWPGVTL